MTFVLTAMSIQMISLRNMKIMDVIGGINHSKLSKGAPLNGFKPVAIA